MKKVLIIGNAGAGKSTFAKKLAQKTCLPLVHLDRIYWQGNWDHISREEFDEALQTELEKDLWIIDGNFSRTLPHRLQYCDTVFWFDLPVAVCLWGATKRVLQSYGKTRSDMGGNCPEYFDKNKLSLYKGILTYNQKHRKNYQAMLAKTGTRLIVFRSHRQVKRYIDAL